MFPKSRSHLRVKLHPVFRIWSIWKVQRSHLKSTKPETRQIKNNLKCSTSHAASNEASRKCKNPSDGSIVLVLGCGFKSRINRLFNCRFFLKRYSVCFTLFVLHFIVTPCLAVAIHPGMEWIPVKKRCVSLGKLAGEKSHNTLNYEKRYFERNLSLQLHILRSMRSHWYL